MLFVYWVFFFCFVSYALLAEPIDNDSESSHGTCAVAILDNANMALVIDSWLTYNDRPKPCSYPHPCAYKAVRVRNDLLLATTGAFYDHEGTKQWSFRDEARTLLEKMPQKLSKEDLDRFASQWINVVGEHYNRVFALKGRAGLPTGPQADISTLLVMTRINGVPYAVRFQTHWDGSNFGTDETEAQIPSIGPTVMFAGSCRDSVKNASRIVALSNKPNPAQTFEMMLLRDRRMSANRVEDFVGIAKDYEDVLARLSQEEDRCYIGPPYDVATWANGKPGWDVNFDQKCAQGIRY
jgi:hypothetical protein